MKLWKLEDLEQIRQFFYLTKLFKNLGGVCRNNFVQILSQVVYTLINVSVWRINFITMGIIKNLRDIQLYINIATDIGHVSININHLRFVNKCTCRILNGIKWSEVDKRNSLMLDPIIVKVVEQLVGVANIDPYKDIIVTQNDINRIIFITKSIGWKQCFQMEIIV